MTEVIGVFIAAGACLIGLLTYLRGRPRIKVRAFMDSTGHALGRVTNNGGRKLQIAKIDLVVLPPRRFRVRHPRLARREHTHPVSSKATAFSAVELDSNAETERRFEFDDRREFNLPVNRFRGPAFQKRAPSRGELRMWARVPGKRAKASCVKQLPAGQFIAPPDAR